MTSYTSPHVFINGKVVDPEFERSAGGCCGSFADPEPVRPVDTGSSEPLDVESGCDMANFDALIADAMVKLNELAPHHHISIERRHTWQSGTARTSVWSVLIYRTAELGKPFMAFGEDAALEFALSKAIDSYKRMSERATAKVA